MTDKYKPMPDKGSLRATQSKRTPMSPDYWGNITINLGDDTNLVRDGKLITVKLSGWKKTDSSGKTFLSIGVDRWVPNQESKPKPKSSGFDDMENDVPF